MFTLTRSVGIASVFQIIHSQQYNPADQELPYELALSMAWGNVELHLAVFIGKQSARPKHELRSLPTIIKALLLCYDQFFASMFPVCLLEPVILPVIQTPEALAGQFGRERQV